MKTLTRLMAGFLLLAGFAQAQVAVNAFVNGHVKFWNGSTVLAGGKLCTYSAGTTNPLATYTDNPGTVANTNPVILDANGEATVFLQALSYKYVLRTPGTDNTCNTGTVVWTQDNVSAVTAGTFPSITTSGNIIDGGNLTVSGDSFTFGTTSPTFQSCATCSSGLTIKAQNHPLSLSSTGAGSAGNVSITSGTTSAALTIATQNDSSGASIGAINITGGTEIGPGAGGAINIKSGAGLSGGSSADVTITGGGAGSHINLVSGFGGGFVRVEDGTDTTKSFHFITAGITTGNDRAYTAPDASGTLVLDTATQTLTNKSLTSPTFTGTVTTSRVLASGTAPTGCAFATGGGTSPSCTFAAGATDSDGRIQAATGTGSPGSAGTVTLTFSSTFGTNTPTCEYQLSSTNGVWNGRATATENASTTSGVTIVWDNNSVALSTSTTYNINYHCSAH